MPSQRAQSLQVAQMAGAFARAGAPTTLLHARRRTAPELPAGVDLWEWYGLPPVRAGEAGPRLEAVPCVDWIDRVPPALQYLPARVQELSFARNAARRVAQGFAGARVYAREAEIALALVRRGRADVFLEIHRVPGGRLRRRWLCEAAAGARGVVAISGGVRDDLARLGVDAARIRVEHDAFEPGRFAARPARDAARAELGLSLDAPVVVYAGGLLAWKGVDVLVDAARALPGVRFVVAGGTDADVARLRERARGLANVRIEGFQPPARVPLYLAAADLGVAPNRSQPAISARHTSPLKVFEMMAAGLPIVASDLPSLREILAEGTEAVFVAPDDPAALAAGIARLVGEPELGAAMGRRLAARAAGCSWDARAARILAWMES
jgi:glycosyltransferase involved in cell wall biosynthesis